MTDDFETLETTDLDNASEYSVSNLSLALKKAVEGTFPRVKVRGEVGRVFLAQSGHAYISLKDETAVLEAICFRSKLQGLAVPPEPGMEVVCTGRVSTFARKSQYQLVIEGITPAGIGALMAMLEERRKKLGAEGLFDQIRKKPIPILPDIIGVVTSLKGAVLRDILHRLRDRFPRKVLVWPTLVQGDDAPKQIVAAIRGFNELTQNGVVKRPDLIIVARGGGSIEDLWCFNDEAVVRSVAESDIPLISAIGHETDTTLIDLVADQRAPTPTAAAEMAVPVQLDLLHKIQEIDQRMLAGLLRRIREGRAILNAAAGGLRSPGEFLEQVWQRLDYLWVRIDTSLKGTTARNSATLEGVLRVLHPGVLGARIADGRSRLVSLNQTLSQYKLWNLEQQKAKLQSQASQLAPHLFVRLIERFSDRLMVQSRVLSSLSYENILARGFVLVHNKLAAQPVKSVIEIGAGDLVTLEFHDGSAEAQIKNGVNIGDRKENKNAKLLDSQKTKEKKDQGDLF